MNFSNKAKELREMSGLSQMRLSEKIGISAAAIGFLENHDNEPKGSTVVAYAKFFDVTADYLLGLEDDGIKTAAPMNGSLSYSSEEHKIIEQYRSLPKQLQELIRNQLEIYCAPETLNKSDKKV